MNNLVPLVGSAVLGLCLWTGGPALGSLRAAEVLKPSKAIKLDSPDSGSLRVADGSKHSKVITLDSPDRLPKWEAGISFGGGIGLEKLGSRVTHNTGLLKVDVVRNFAPVFWQDHWYESSLSLVTELFAGGQFNPKKAYLFGLDPLLRYNFIGLRKMLPFKMLPFIEGGAGVAGTNIREPDLGSIFEFNPLIGVGVQWHLTKRLDLSTQIRLSHFSNAGITDPNSGVNQIVIFTGVTWVF